MFLHSLTHAQLDARLTELGAATFGSIERKRQRLQRFLRARKARIVERHPRAAFLARNRSLEEPPLKRRRIEA